MAGARVAAVIVLLSVSITGTAHAQQVDCCNALELVPREPDPQPEGPSLQQTYGLLAGGAAAAITSYVFGVLVATTESNRLPAVDGIPVVGPIASAARNAADERGASFLSLAGAAQAMSLLVVAAAATDLVDRRRMLINLGAGPNGCGASVTWRLP
jgi:hypothetical protein